MMDATPKAWATTDAGNLDEPDPEVDVQWQSIARALRSSAIYKESRKRERDESGVSI